MRILSRPATRTFTALPTSWLWPAGAPIWPMSVLGAVVAISAVAVPALPTVLPDKPPSGPNPVALAPAEHNDSTKPSDSGQASTPGRTGPDQSPASSQDPTSLPAVSATTEAGETPSEAPKATGTPSTSPPASSPIETTETTAQPTPTGGNTPQKPQPVTIAATDPGNQRWLVTATDCDPCVSGSRIIGLGLLATLTIPVDVDAAGSHQLTIAYETRRQRDLYINVNNGKAQKLKLAGTGGWTKPGWASLSVTLEAGSNEITFSNPLGLAPDLDQITVG